MTDKPQVTFESLMTELASIKGDWWLHDLRERRSNIVFATDNHKPTDPPTFLAKLQCVDGGRLTSGIGNTPIEALQNAIESVKKRFTIAEE